MYISNIINSNICSFHLTLFSILLVILAIVCFIFAYKFSDRIYEDKFNKRNENGIEEHKDYKSLKSFNAKNSFRKFLSQLLLVIGFISLAGAFLDFFGFIYLFISYTK